MEKNTKVWTAGFIGSIGFVMVSKTYYKERYWGPFVAMALAGAFIGRGLGEKFIEETPKPY